MALPLWHGIELVRAFWFGNITSGVLVHIGYFVVMIAAGLFVTSRRLRALFLR
jgi:lipooligosaccharide transport system permease protein